MYISISICIIPQTYPQCKNSSELFSGGNPGREPAGHHHAATLQNKMAEMREFGSLVNGIAPRALTWPLAADQYKWLF